MTGTKLGRISALIFAGCIATGAASAEELRYAHGWPAQSAIGQASESLDSWLQELSGGTLSATVYHGSLLGMSELPSGLSDGIADIGAIVPIYTPADYPLTNMLADVAMHYEVQDAGKNIGFAFAGALMDFIINDCTECQTEFSSQNQVYTSGMSAPRYLLMCTKPMSELDQLTGARVRVAGPQWAGWVEAVGARPVSLAGSEVLQALSQGVADCAITNGAELRGLGLMDVVTDIVTAPLGIYGGALAANINGDRWRSLTSEQRRALLQASARLSARMTVNYIREASANIDEAQARGVNLLEPSSDLVAVAHTFIEGNVATLPDLYQRNFAVQNGAELITRFIPVMERWARLTADIDTEAQLADLYWTEVLSKVDVETYGH